MVGQVLWVKALVRAGTMGRPGGLVKEFNRYIFLISIKILYNALHQSMVGKPKTVQLVPSNCSFFHLCEIMKPAYVRKRMCQDCQYV